MAVYDGITLQLAERLAFLFNPIAIDGGRWIREVSCRGLYYYYSIAGIT